MVQWRILRSLISTATVDCICRHTLLLWSAVERPSKEFVV